MLIVNGPQKSTQPTSVRHSINNNNNAPTGTTSAAASAATTTTAQRSSSMKNANSTTASGVSNTCQRSHSTVGAMGVNTHTHINNNNNNNNPATLGNTQISASMTIRRILQLYELGECREAAQVISRLPYGTFRAVVLDLPVDVFVEAMPGSLPILDALYAKVFFAGRDLLAFGFKFLHPENVVSHMIRMFALGNIYQQQNAADALAICKKLLKVILLADPSLRKQLVIKKALLDRAVEGMGHHGLVGTSNDALMNLHEALKLEFERVISQYRCAINKIDELSLAKEIKDGGPVTRSLSQGPAPTFSSHQRLLSLKQEEIHERLNKNRALLCALEPCFRTNHSLQILLAILQKRIDYDKETLFQFGQLRKEFQTNEAANTSNSGCSTSSSSAASSPTGTVADQQRRTSVALFERDAVVAPVLMRFSHGCAQVLQLLKEIQQESGGNEMDDEEMLVTATTGVAPNTQQTQDESSNHGHHHHHHEHHHNHHHQQHPSKQASPTNTASSSTQASSALDDCSDISGYHSDSEGSPTALRSPRSGTTSDISGGCGVEECNVVCDRTDCGAVGCRIGKNCNGTIENTNCNSSGGVSGGVSIMTGSADGTTLLNGQVTVNSGCDDDQVATTTTAGYRTHGTVRSGAGSAVCRIELRSEQVPEVPDDYLRCELAQARTRIEQLEAAHSAMQRKLNAQTHRLASLGLTPGVEYSRLDESNRTNAIVRAFEQLYSHERTNALDALERHAELQGCDELKEKLLFSVLVLTYRSTATTLKNLRENIAEHLQIDSWMSSCPDHLTTVNSQKALNKSLLVDEQETETTFDTGSGSILQQLENSLLIYLRTTSASFDLTTNVKEVHKQICDTLFDYPCLSDSSELMEFIGSCARIGWRLHLEPGHFRLDIDARHFRPEWHCRAPDADPCSDSIKCYVWPTLFQEAHCVHRGRVIT